jgi:tetratricopeptide (TPR) repeat protein
MKKIFFFFIVVLGVFLYYFLNDSYRYSLEAKAYYELGEYEKAYKLAQKAYKLDKYNRMAFTIVTQTKIAKIWQNFIKESNEYFVEIDSISNKETITNADKIKIKMMLEIIIGEYKNLPHSKLLNKELEVQADKNYKRAKELYNGIFKTTT